MVEKLLELIDKNKVLFEEGKPKREYLGGSFVGEFCLRKTQWKAQAVEPDEDRRIKPHIYRIFDRGHDGEDRMIEYLRRAGLIIRTEKPDGTQYGFSVMKGMFRGHIDGLIVGTKDGVDVDFKTPCIWENKVLNHKSFTHLKNQGLQKSKPLYYAQLQTYIYFMDTEKNPALFTFMNANDCEVHAFMIPYDGVFVSEILNKAETVIRAILAGETLERGTDDQDSFMCRFCDFKTRCWA
tara:strand:- start:102 stop:815 length:714 start_codon:yes stop_codon:yes gene_type:complete